MIVQAKKFVEKNNFLLADYDTKASSPAYAHPFFIFPNC